MSLRVTQGVENAEYAGKLSKYHPDNAEPVVPVELTKAYMTMEQLKSFEPSLPGVYAQPGFRLHRLAPEQTYPTTTDAYSLNKAVVANKVGQKVWLTDLGKTQLATGPGHA
ncbi:hypothetical protein KFE25_001390 [Diacronema lutheri]|uniref:Uncharacterized protein n=1 Tax=Diacronema lutheri TaxID=2081491 RepID=A0A8J5XDM0_DIALT|nr:hypothetical protein KFE25_001390 [Diacronema lutheri]|mmetsp:Transcript_11205/g.35363  ORF Transcript_11205/g.35363 Transcript_11205/m.35363 type:complete len:111 (-) Transcript_11205:218-550(-)